MTRVTCHAGSGVRAGSAAAGHAILGSALALDGGPSVGLGLVLVWSWLELGGSMDRLVLGWSRRSSIEATLCW